MVDGSVLKSVEKAGSEEKIFIRTVLDGELTAMVSIDAIHQSGARWQELPVCAVQRWGARV